MVKMFKCMLVLIILLSSLAVADSCIYYFYGDGCEGCPEASEFIKDLEESNQDLKVEKYEVYYSLANTNLLKEYIRAYQIPEEAQGIPIVLTEKAYFVGKEAISNLAEKQIINSECPSLENVEVVGIVGESSSKSVLESLTFSSVTGFALANGFSAGALTLMLLLFLLLISIRKTSDVLQRGLLFVLGIFVAYFLFGTGLFSWFGYSNVSKIASKIIALVVLIITLATIKHFFISWEITLKKRSENFKASANLIIENLTSVYGTLIMGLIFGLLSFTWLTKPLLSTRYLFMEGSHRLVALPILVYYLLLFILPMLIVVITIYFIRDYFDHKSKKKFKDHEKKAELWEFHYLKILNFVIQIIMLVLSIAILFI
jgi:hypothetical protein